MKKEMKAIGMFVYGFVYCTMLDYVFTYWETGNEVLIGITTAGAFIMTMFHIGFIIEFLLKCWRIKDAE